MAAVRRYGYALRVLIGLDHFANAVLGGSPSETISSRVGRGALIGDRLALACEVVINALFFWRPNHCRRAIGT